MGQGSLAIQLNSRKHLAARIWMMHYVAQCMLNVGAQGDYTVPTATCLLHLRGGFPPLAHHGPVWSAWFPTASRRVGLHGRILESGWPDASIFHAKDAKYASMRGFSAGHDEAVGEYISARLYICKHICFQVRDDGLRCSRWPRTCESNLTAIGKRTCPRGCPRADIILRSSPSTLPYPCLFREDYQ